MLLILFLFLPVFAQPVRYIWKPVAQHLPTEDADVSAQTYYVLNIHKAQYMVKSA